MSADILSIVARKLGVPIDAFQPLSGGHVSRVYGFERDGRALVLRLVPPEAGMDLHSQQAVMAWVKYLAENGADVITPIPFDNGELVDIIPGEKGEWQALVCEQASGVLSEKLPMEKWDAPLIQTFGQAVGKMHNLARKYTPSAGMRRPEWFMGGNLFNRPELSQAWLKPKQAAILERIRNLPRGGDEYHMIHADLHFANFFVEPRTRTITLFDFDDCCYGWSVMDISIVLFDALVEYKGQDKDVFARHFMRNFLSGYKTENPIGVFWITQVPNFLKLLEINLYDEFSPHFNPEGGDPWINSFIPGRKRRIQDDQPYVDIDFEILAVVRPDAPVRLPGVQTEPKKVAPRIKPPVTSELRDTALITERAKTRPAWREVRAMLAVQMFTSGRLSADRAARLAGLSRVEFLLGLGFYKIFPLMDELRELEKRHE